MSQIKRDIILYLITLAFVYVDVDLGIRWLVQQLDSDTSPAYRQYEYDVCEIFLNFFYFLSNIEMHTVQSDSNNITYNT